MQSELQTIREQMRADLKTIMKAFSVQRDAVAKALETQRVEVTKALKAQEDLLGGYIARTDERFGRILSLVEEIQQWRTTVDDRLDAIEGKLAG